MFLQHDNLIANVWRDNKLVYVMSTNVPHQMTTCARKEKNGSVKDVAIPESIKLYNQYMNGVDRADQLRSYYHYKLKSRKFYMYIFFFLFESCKGNSFVLQKKYSPSPVKFLKIYRLALAERLIGNYNSRHRYGLPQVIQDTAPVKSLPPRKRKLASECGRHFPIKSNRGKCVYCWNSNEQRHESSIRCRQCKVALCIVSQEDDGISCFEKYHT